jgi:hypothetical protein
MSCDEENEQSNIIVADDDEGSTIDTLYKEATECLIDTDGFMNIMHPVRPIRAKEVRIKTET